MVSRRYRSQSGTRVPNLDRPPIPHCENSAALSHIGSGASGEHFGDSSLLPRLFSIESKYLIDNGGREASCHCFCNSPKIGSMVGMPVRDAGDVRLKVPVGARASIEKSADCHQSLLLWSTRVSESIEARLQLRGDIWIQRERLIQACRCRKLDRLHAARSYSWIRPPRTSRLITDPGGASNVTEADLGTGGFMSSERWGR